MKYLLGNTAREAADRSLALQEDIEARFASTLRVETDRAMREMVAQYQATGRAPDVVFDHEGRMSEIWANMAQVSISAFGGRVVDEGKSRGLVLETKSFAEFFARLALDYIQLEAIRRRITMVSNTTRTQIITLIEAGQASGSTLAEIARNILDAIPGISANRAAIISRTEVHGAANYGAHNAAKSTGLELVKEWVSVEDVRTRSIFRDDKYDHVQMNGVTVDMDQPFMVPVAGGLLEPMQYTGDPAGSAGNVINCRCQTVHAVKGLDD